MTKVLFLFSVPAFGVTGPGFGFSKPGSGFSKPGLENSKASVKFFTASAVNPARRVATTGPDPGNTRPGVVTGLSAFYRREG